MPGIFDIIGSLLGAGQPRPSPTPGAIAPDVANIYTPPQHQEGLGGLFQGFGDALRTPGRDGYTLGDKLGVIAGMMQDVGLKSPEHQELALSRADKNRSLRNQQSAAANLRAAMLGPQPDFQKGLAALTELAGQGGDIAQLGELYSLAMRQNQLAALPKGVPPGEQAIATPEIAGAGVVAPMGRQVGRRPSRRRPY